MSNNENNYKNDNNSYNKAVLRLLSFDGRPVVDKDASIYALINKQTAVAKDWEILIHSTFLMTPLKHKSNLFLLALQVA